MNAKKVILSGLVALGIGFGIWKATKASEAAPPPFPPQSPFIYSNIRSQMVPNGAWMNQNFWATITNPEQETITRQAALMWRYYPTATPTPDAPGRVIGSFAISLDPGASKEFYWDGLLNEMPNIAYRTTSTLWLEDGAGGKSAESTVVRGS